MPMQFMVCVSLQKNSGGLYKNAAMEHIQCLQSAEQAKFVQVSIYGSLYMLGQRKYLQPLIALLSTEDYHVICAVLRTLADISCSENSNEIAQVLLQLREKNLPVAVQEAYDELIQAAQF